VTAVGHLDGKVALVTGGNTGIGFETAIGLAQAGADVVITSRDRQRGATAAVGIESRTGRAVDVAALDLTSFASVREFAKAFLDTHDRLDILVNNAGLVLRERRVTEDGHETQFQTNHLGPFLLTGLLRERLEACAPARIVVVSSEAHRVARRGLDFDDLESARSYRGFRTYGRTKLMNLLFTRELARRLDGTHVTVNAVHPGYVASRFGRDGDTGVLLNVGMILGRPFARTPKVGAETSVYVASSPELEGVSGRYFARSRPAQPAAAAEDDEAANRLWDVSEALTGLT
jgi:NAD(P)-dependent dehydrogenase (short-subunit alcohol dehydrogenase family)